MSVPFRSSAVGYQTSELRMSIENVARCIEVPGSSCFPGNHSFCGEWAERMALSLVVAGQSHEVSVNLEFK